MLLSTELGIPFMNYKLSFSSVTIQNRCNMSATKPINESALILHDSALGSTFDYRTIRSILLHYEFFSSDFLYIM